MWRNLWLVARREYIENVKTKAFWIGVLALPLILGFALGITAILEKSGGPAKTFAVVAGGDHGLREKLEQAYLIDKKIQEKFRWRGDVAVDLDKKALGNMVAAGDLFAYVRLPDDVVKTGKASYAARNHADRTLMVWMESQLRTLVRDARFEREGVEPDVKTRLLEPPVELEKEGVSETGESKKLTVIELARTYSPIVFVYMLFIAVMTVAQLLLTNVIEEKASRVIEVLLSSLTPIELMGGKIAGTAATGLTLLGSWLLTIVVGLNLGGATAFGVSAAQIYEIIVTVLTPYNLFFFLTYFLLGFMLYSGIFAAIGSLVGSIKEAQNLMAPIVIVMMVPVLTMFFVTKNPHAPLGVVLSYIPPFTPFLMMNRIAAIPPAPWWEGVLSIVFLMVCVAFTFRLAARVFRVGVLMTGKPPTLKEIWRMAWTR